MGYPVRETAKLASVYNETLHHLWDTPPEEAADLPGGGMYTPFYVGFNGRAFAGGRARDPMRVRELIPELQQVVRAVPGALGAFRQASIFQRGATGADIEVNVVGPDPDRLREIGNEALRMINASIPDVQAAPASSIDGVPELQVIPDRKRMAEAGISARELGFAVGALVDGIKAADYRWQGKRIDLKVVATVAGWGSASDTPQEGE
jgi:HAE1 family hydrophobic/amphiphilic exporter-1